MAETNAGPNSGEKMYDPFEPFRGMRDAYLDSMSKAMIDAVNTESYAQATGAMLDCYLTASAPFREAVEKSMLQTMQHLSLPSRQEVASLAERFTNLEMRFDDMDAKLDNMTKQLAAMRQPVAKEPAAPQSRPEIVQPPRRNSERDGPRK
jgi:hypothetical protein